jgi:decaprenyl-phosphate phosphoribosyltransferase
MVFFPPFLSGALIHTKTVSEIALPFLAFCCASSATYVINDILDIEQDALHSKKRYRPLPSGDISQAGALFLAIIFFGMSVLLAWFVSSLFLLYVLLYIVISTAYSLYFKNLPIFDIFCISFGFVFRLYGGGAAFSVKISDWLFLSVFLLSIFLSVGKRYSEQVSMGDKAELHRRTLKEYPDGFLDAAMHISGSAVLITYSLYVISRPLLIYTVPLCLFGLFRYIVLIKSGCEGDPSAALLKDIHLMIIGIIWIFMVGLSIYR